MSLILRTFLENESAIKRLLARFFPRKQDVEDLAQETFLRAYAAEAEQEVHAPKAFLFRVAKNLALNARARHANIMTDSLEDSVDPDVLLQDGQASADDQVEARQRMRLLEDAVAALPPQCARVFLMRKVHGLSHKEIAQALGISVSTVEKHIAAGLTRCSDFLRRHGYETGGRGLSAARHAGGAEDKRRGHTSDD